MPRKTDKERRIIELEDKIDMLERRIISLEMRPTYTPHPTPVPYAPPINPIVQPIVYGSGQSTSPPPGTGQAIC